VSFSSRADWENASVVGCRPVEALLRLPVRVRGIQLGRPFDVVLDLDRRRAIGLEVICGDGSRRYLPLAAARVREDEIVIGSSLLLLTENDLAFYRRRARMLRDLRGNVVERGGRALGSLVDVLLAEDGAVAGLVVDGGGRRHSVPFDETVSIAARGKVTAA
jgi:sporulation protein YlmC with PRC-barrel domain